MTQLWRRYPGRLAHLEGFDRPIEHPSGTRIGTRWLAQCGRPLNLWWNEDGADRGPSADVVAWEDLVAEEPRGWCLRCRYWALQAALVELPEFGWFVDAIVRGARVVLEVPS